MTVVDSASYVNTIYNAPFWTPLLLQGGVYNTPTATDTPFPTSLATPNYAIGGSSLTLGSSYSTALGNTFGFPKYAVFWGPQQLSVFDTDYANRQMYDFTATASFYVGSGTTTPYVGSSDLQYHGLRMQKTYRFMSHQWYGYGYQRSARIELRAKKVSRDEYVARVSPFLFVARAAFFGGPFPVYRGISLVSRATVVFSGSGDYVEPYFNGVQLAGDRLYSGLRCLNENFGWMDRYFDIGASVTSNFSSTAFPRLIYSGLVANNSGFASSVGNVTNVTTGVVNEFLTFWSLEMSLFNANQVVTDVASIMGITVIVSYRSGYPTSSTEAFLPAPFPQNAPFSSSSRRDGWFSKFQGCEETIIASQLGATIVYSPFTQASSGQTAQSDMHWCGFSNAWYAGDRTTSGNGWKDLETRAIPPFPGYRCEGLFPRDVRRWEIGSYQAREEKFVGLDVVNIVVLSDLSAKYPDSTIANSYNLPATTQLDAGGANDLFDPYTVYAKSKKLLPAFRGFKTLVFYDVDAPALHERLEAPYSTLIPSTDANDSFYAHTANWDGCFLYYFTRDGIATAVASYGFPIATRYLTDFCTIRTISLSNVHEMRKSLAIESLRTRISSADPNGEFVVWCGTISQTTANSVFLQRILDNS